MAALGIATTDSNARAVEGAASIVFAVKPQVMRRRRAGSGGRAATPTSC